MGIDCLIGQFANDKIILQNNIQNSTNAYNILKNIFNLIGTDLSTNKGKEALQTLGVLLKQGNGRIYTLKDLFQLDASDPLANVQLFSQNSNLNFLTGCSLSPLKFSAADSLE